METSPRLTARPSRLRDPRGLHRVLTAIGVVAALQLAGAACAGAMAGGPASDPETAPISLAQQPHVFSNEELRMASTYGTLYEALSSLRGDILHGPVPGSEVRARKPAVVYVNGLRMRDAESLRRIAVWRVKRVEIVPLFGVPRSHVNRYPPGSIHVTLIPVERQSFMSILGTVQ